ncbi:GNAT family N-acetyltransferase [Alicyclobacillus macrosporangiidus]|uniref:GNAT family N-acetyltransferase n=1 Tax=Alicyclobacillus macrosporangiidus TaxID=392015 RepID=UPI00049607FE|nr:GNAT family N-acetyltransferase [Alicyclobacillus macrosporangiidus]
MEIRKMKPQDIEQVTVLCEQFGYPARTEEVEERFQRLCRLAEHQLFVVEENSAVVGWIHVHGIHSLSSAPYAEIRGIVVDRQYRQQGVGRMLMLKAEQWALDNGYRVVRLRSGTERPESHHFYPKLGYERTKTQHHYQKVLAES